MILFGSAFFIILGCVEWFSKLLIKTIIITNILFLKKWIQKSSWAISMTFSRSSFGMVLDAKIRKIKKIRRLRRSGLFVVNFQEISLSALVFSFLNLNK